MWERPTSMRVADSCTDSLAAGAAAVALRGYKVIVPVDGASSALPYREQYTAWHLANSPRVGPQVR